MDVQITAQSAGIQECTAQTVSAYCLLSYTRRMSRGTKRHQEGGVLTVKHQPDVRGVSGVLSGGLGSPPWVLFSDVHPGIEALALLSPWSPPLPFADRWGIKSPCPSALKLDSSSPPRKLLGHQRLLLGLPTRQEPGGPEIHLLPLCPSPAFFLGRQVGDGSLCSLCLSLSHTHTLTHSLTLAQNPVSAAH